MSYEQREALARKGGRELAFGCVWFAVGVIITLATLSSSSPIYIVAWGPMLYGLIQVFLGIRHRAKARQ